MAIMLCYLGHWTADLLPRSWGDHSIHLGRISTIRMASCRVFCQISVWRSVHHLRKLLIIMMIGGIWIQTWKMLLLSAAILFSTTLTWAEAHRGNSTGCCECCNRCLFMFLMKSTEIMLDFLETLSQYWYIIIVLFCDLTLSQGELRFKGVYLLPQEDLPLFQFLCIISLIF